MHNRVIFGHPLVNNFTFNRCELIRYALIVTRNLGLLSRLLLFAKANINRYVSRYINENNRLNSVHVNDELYNDVHNVKVDAGYQATKVNERCNRHRKARKRIFNIRVTTRFRTNYNFSDYNSCNVKALHNCHGKIIDKGVVNCLHERNGNSGQSHAINLLNLQFGVSVRTSRSEHTNGLIYLSIQAIGQMNSTSFP